MKTIAVALVLAGLAGAAPAGAHVRVYPDSALTRTPACAFTKFVVRVPTEKPIATTVVALTVPEGVTAVATQTKPGWHADLTRRNGRVVAVRWSGGRIEPREFDEFALLGAAPRRAITVDWNADQTYEDGSVVHWTGAPNSATPHAQTIFTAPAGACKPRGTHG